MTRRICPECETKGEGEICPKCGTRTLFDAPSDPGIDPLIGKVFDGRYRIEEMLGKGGMGAVYKAVQIAMNKRVAVKVVRSDLASNLEAARRFHREAKAASRLSQPHSIRVFDFGQTRDRELFMVMEYIKGRSLSEVIHEEERLPAGRVAKIGAEIAQALIEAHDQGFIHRDLKPDNVILLPVHGDSDFVKVLDFGIAKFLSGSSGDSTVTRTGAVIGTPQYMAPEQARARNLSTSTDIYGLGIILYEMLVGCVPYTGDTPVDVLMAHVNDPIPPIPAEVDAPAELVDLINGMLEKQPGARPSAREVFEELEGIRLEYAAARHAKRRASRKAKRGLSPVVEREPVRNAAEGLPAKEKEVQSPSPSRPPVAPLPPRQAPPIVRPSSKSEPTESILGDVNAADEMPAPAAEEAEAPSAPSEPELKAAPLAEEGLGEEPDADDAVDRSVDADEPSPTPGPELDPEPEPEPEPEAGEGAVDVASDSVPLGDSALDLVFPRRRMGAWLWWGIAGISIGLALILFLARGGDPGSADAEPDAVAMEEVTVATSTEIDANKSVAAERVVEVVELAGIEDVVEAGAASEDTATPEPEAGTTVSARPKPDVRDEPAPVRPPPPPPKVRVHFASTPSDASVYLGAKRLGKTPFEHAFARDTRRQTFVFKKKGYRDRSVTERLAEGTTVSAELMKRPTPKPPEPEVRAAPKTPPMVKLRFVSRPPGAQVYLGRTYLGDTEFARVFRADRGRLTFTCKKTGYRDVSVSVDVASQRKVSCSLAPLDF